MTGNIPHISPPGKPPLSVKRQREAYVRELKRRRGGLSPLDPLEVLRSCGLRSWRCPPSHLINLPGLRQRLEYRSRLEFEAFCRSHPELADEDDAEGEAQPVKRTRQRKPTLAGVVRQATKAGVEVARYDVRPDGTISVVSGKPVGDIDMDDTTSSDPRWN